MPPTLKDSSALPTSSEGSERTAPGAADPSITQPMALEVPVTVNSAKALEGSEKREPFSETTTTVLILANGAVLRLSTSVEPGQRLSLTNEKTKKEILCQVVKSKGARTASGYVEVEFTQPVQGFWGTRFPNITQASTPVSSARKLDPDPSVSGIPSITAAPKSTTFTDAPPSALEFNSNLADPVQDLKTEIKADSRSSSKADFFAATETPAGAPKLESNRLQEQLSALLAAEQQQIESPLPAKVELTDTAAKILEIAAQAPAAKVPVPAKSDADAIAPPKTASTPATSSFDSEKVQIPAWLEPLARNAAVPAPPAELDATDSADQFDEFEAEKPAPPAADQKPPKAAPKVSSSLPKHAPAAPLFGKTLLDHSTSELPKPRGSNKGLWMSIAAALLLSAASGAWYFRDELASLAAQRPDSPSRSSSISSANASVLPSSPANAAPLTTPSAPAASTPDTLASVAAKPSNERTPAAQPTSNASSSQGRMETAAITERIPKAHSDSSTDATSSEPNSVEIVEPEVRKSLGKVRLAKPKVGHSANSQANGNGEVAPSLDAGNEASSEDQNPLSANLANSSNQPAAPVVVGGDVTPARLISSVPPVYPALAKTQHISGDVRIDALIDASGRVTTMKVISGPSLLHQAAMDALHQWKYQPASLDSKPASMHLTVTIQFRLQ